MLDTKVYASSVNQQISTHSGFVPELPIDEDQGVYPWQHYQLDFHYDVKQGWFKSMNERIAENLSNGVFMLTNFSWMLNLQISEGAGFLLAEIFNFDFITNATTHLVSNMQKIAGVSKAGFDKNGLVFYLIPILLIVIAVYTAYVGGIKGQVAKALSALINFTVVLILSSLFLVYAGTYLNHINEFSKEMTTKIATAGLNVIGSGSNQLYQDNPGQSIRENLRNIQIRQPWLLMSFGTTDESAIGADRIHQIERLASGSDERQDLIEDEIKNHNNNLMGNSGLGQRFGMVIAIGLMNIIISLFVLLIACKTILYQALFILYAMFLPISFLMSLVPSFESTSRRAIIKLFNLIMMRIGITVVIVGIFSLSSLAYSLTQTTPYIFIMMVQLIIFVGLWTQLGNIMDMFSFNDKSGAGSVNNRIVSPIRRTARNIMRGVGVSKMHRELKKIGGKETTQEETPNQPNLMKGKNGGRRTEKEREMGRGDRLKGNTVNDNKTTNSRPNKEKKNQANGVTFTMSNMARAAKIKKAKSLELKPHQRMKLSQEREPQIKASKSKISPTNDSRLKIPRIKSARVGQVSNHPQKGRIKNLIRPQNKVMQKPGNSKSKDIERINDKNSKNLLSRTTANPLHTKNGLKNQPSKSPYLSNKETNKATQDNKKFRPRPVFNKKVPKR